MNLQDLREIISLAKDIIIAAAAAWAGIIGFLGLQAWRRELKGKSAFVKAKEVLKAVYRVREAFKHVRHPAIFQYEYPKELCDETGRLKKGQQYEGHVQVYEARWKIMAAAFSTLEEQTLDAQVEWGADFLNVIMPLRTCKVNLQIAIQDHLEALNERGFRERKSVEEMQKDRDILYYAGENPDRGQFTNHINQAIQKFEEKLRPLIK